MTRLRVKAKKLNKRKVIPSFLPDPSNIVGIVNENFTFEGEEITDVPNKALGNWYRDRDGHFYWGGGVEANSTKSFSASINFTDYFNLSFIPEKMSWAHRFLEIPFIWNDIKTAGRDVVVGIIDTGVDTHHEDLKACFLSTSIHVDNSGVRDESSAIEQRIQDSDGHGTEMAGIIAATGKQVYGIAPECKLLIIKLDGDVGRTAVSVAEAIRYLINKEVDVISISQSAPDEPVLQNAIAESLLNKIPIFAAIGNGHTSLNPIDDDSFPACYDGCTAVGAFDENGNLCNFSQRNAHLSFLAPGSKNNILTTAMGNKVINCRGQTSIATAIVAGCFALVISFLKKSNRIDLKQTALEQLKFSCDDMGPVIGPDSDHGFGRINLRNTFSRIKTLI